MIPPLAYIGPGAGFAFIGSMLSLIGGLLVSLSSILFWPVRLTWRTLARRRGLRAEIRWFGV